MTIHTYVISLKENNEERRENIVKQLDKTALEYTILDAVVGSSVIKQTDDRLNENSQHLRAGQIGCALSHIECYKLAKINDLDYVLIIEDDFLLKTDISLDLSAITESLSGKSVGLLHWATFAGETLYLDEQHKTELPSVNSMYQLKSGRPLCATAYICTREAYQSLLKNLLPLQTVADDWPRFLDKGFIDKIYLVEPATVTVQNFESQIGYGAQGGRLKNLSIWIQQKRVPIFKLLAQWHLNRLSEKNRKRVIV